jgi:hypothetical protein
VKDGKLYLIPIGKHGTGRGTVFMAKLWKQEVQQLLLRAPPLRRRG